MKKIICLMFLILLVGCINNRTEELCSIMKHSEQNKTIYMDDGVCIMESENYTYVDYVHCINLIEEVNVILKHNNEEFKGVLEEHELNKVCEVERLN